MKVTVEKNKLTIELDLIDPQKPSKSGKTLIVASTSGFQSSNATINGKPVKVSVNAIIAKD